MAYNGSSTIAEEAAAQEVEQLGPYLFRRYRCVLGQDTKPKVISGVRVPYFYSKSLWIKGICYMSKCDHVTLTI